MTALRQTRHRTLVRLGRPLTPADLDEEISVAGGARISGRLAEHPDAIDSYTGRQRRVALVSDASTLPAGTDPAATLAGMETAAAFLDHHSGLEITPLPIDAGRGSLADAVAALSPGFTAVCLHQTRPDRVDAVRGRLDRLQPRLPVLDTGDDATAVTMIAALINAVRRAGSTLGARRILVVGAPIAPEIGALLTAVGARDLTFAGSPAAETMLDELSVAYDVLLDLPAITLTLSSDAGPHQLHPLPALPGLLSVAVHRRINIDVAHRFAAAHALARLAPPGHLLPDALDPRITAAVYAAAVDASAAAPASTITDLSDRG